MISHSVDAGEGAVRVVVVDVEKELPELTSLRPDGSRWSGVWLFVRTAGATVGVVEASYGDRDSIAPDEVRRLVEATAAGAAVRPTAKIADDDLPSATIVVASDLNRPDQLRSCVQVLATLDYPDLEVIVVDNHRGHEADGVIDELVDGLPGVRVVREAIPGLSFARNAGIRAARGDFIAFTDDDVLVDPGWLRAIGTRFALRPDEDVVTGLILPTDLETTAQLWFERHYGGFGGPRGFAPLTYRGAGRNKSWGRRARVTVLDWNGDEVRQFAVYGAGICGAGANMAFRTAALRALGGYDSALGAGTPAGSGEDLALFITHLWRGGTIGYEPMALVSHSHREDYAALRSQLYNYGLGFTALLTSIIVADPRHIGGILSQVPAFVRSVVRRTPAPEPVTPPGVVDDLPAPVEKPVPRELKWLEPRGALRGPLAYLHSRIVTRRRSRVKGAGA